MREVFIRIPDGIKTDKFISSIVYDYDAKVEQLSIHLLVIKAKSYHTNAIINRALSYNLQHVVSGWKLPIDRS